jgi:hypothetical protein
MSNEAPGSRADWAEVIARLTAIQDSINRAASNGKDRPPEKIPLIDPTANVLSLVEAAVTRINDLRDTDLKWQRELREQEHKCGEQLQAERQRADSEAKRAESGRIDSLLAASTNNVALALAKQESQALAQEKRIAVVEQNQYQGVGAAGQRVEGRQLSQWAVGIAVVIGIAIVEILVRLLPAAGK